MAKNPLEINENNKPVNDKEKEQLDRAVALVNGGLESLSPEQLALVYKVLKSHSGEVSDAGKAFAKLDTFVQQQLNGFADGKVTYGVSDLQGVSDLNNITSEGRNTPEIEARKKAVEEKVKTEKEKSAKSFGLDHLTPNDGPVLEANLNAVDRMLDGFEPLAKNEKGELLNPEMKAFASFFEHMELDTSNPEGAQSKEALLADALELAVLQAQADLALNPNYRNLDDAQKKKLLAQTVAANADALALKMIKAQMMAEFKAANEELLSKQNLTAEEKAELEKRIKEFNARVVGATRGYIEGKYAAGQKVNISNTVATASVIEGGINLVNRTTAIHQKTGFAGLMDRAVKFNAKMKAKHPKMHKAVSKAMVSGGVGLTTGGVGLAVLSVVRAGQAVRDSYKGYKESGFEGSYGKYLWQNPKELTSLITTTVLSGVSVYFGGADFAEHGLNAMGVIGKSFADTAAQAATNRVTKALVRGTISVTSGLTNAMVDIRAAAQEKDPAKRKQLLKNAAKTAGLSIGAGALGVGLAEYAGDGINWLKGKLGFGAPKVDEITSEAPNVKNLNTNTLTNGNLNMNADMLDKRLHDLGINPNVYEKMSPVEKMMLMRQRENELGDLAKPEKSAEMQQLQEGQAPSEAQLKKMLTRNAERHPDLDMKKVYSQLQAAGVKNPEVAFYKLEQARLLAPNDKILTIDGTNIRQTMERVLKGEALTAADMKVMATAQENVGNGGHYLNDVRSQGGTGYSYRPRGVEGNEHTDSKAGTRTGSGTKIKVSADDITAEGSVDVSKLTEEQKAVYEGIKKSYTAAGVEDVKASTDKAFKEYEALVKAGKTEEAANYLKSINKEVPQSEGDSKEKQKEESAYRAEAGDSRKLMLAKRDAARAEFAYKTAVDRVKLTEAEAKATQNLPLNDTKRVQAEFKHAEAMKDEVKKQMAFSKAELKVAKVEVSDAKKILEQRERDELRVQKIGVELNKLGIDKTDAPKMSGEYSTDRKSVREYFKDALHNKRTNPKILKLLKEREDLFEQMKKEGTRTELTQNLVNAENKASSLSKRILYTENELKENGGLKKEDTAAQTPESKKEEVVQTSGSGNIDYSREDLSKIGSKMAMFKAQVDKGIVPSSTSALADTKARTEIDNLAAKGVVGEKALAELSKNSGVAYDAERNVMIYKGKVFVDPLNNQVNSSRVVIYNEGDKALEQRGFGTQKTAQTSAGNSSQKSGQGSGR